MEKERRMNYEEKERRGKEVMRRERVRGKG